MRGEHYVGHSTTSGQEGSSPHARGARHVGDSAKNPVGIIPACAGSTQGIRDLEWQEQDHPRMRGEHVGKLSTSHGALGSSPHARGALLELVLVELEAGIIPACAGSTAAVPIKRQVYWDHPRMRGEHAELRHEALGVRGSSPHARGAQ